MNINYILSYLKNWFELLKLESADVKIFVFGSILSDKLWPSDIDVLVIYDDIGDACQIRKLLQKAGPNLPLHIICISSVEEAELQFVSGQNCIRVY